MAYTNEDRFSMTAERYLAKHHVLVYMEDSIAQLLEHREENPKINPTKLLSEYFNSLRDGNHTMFREYEFIQATPHNRASFVRLFWKCYRQIGKKGDLLSIQEYHSLVTLLCPDFPFETVQKTARIILLDDALDCLISFADFIYAFQVQFYFEEFLDRCYEIYQSMIQTQSSPRNPVVVPSGAEDTRIHTNNHHPSDGVDAMQYFRAVYPLCDRMTYSTPPAEGLKEILFNVPRVSFYGFLMAIAKSESINESIGRLPPKSELLDGADVELTSIRTDVSGEVSLIGQNLTNGQSNSNSVAKHGTSSKKSPVIVQQNNNSRVMPHPPHPPQQQRTSRPPAAQSTGTQPLPPSRSNTQAGVGNRPTSGVKGKSQPRAHHLYSRQSRKKEISSDESSDDSDSDDSDDD